MLEVGGSIPSPPTKYSFSNSFPALSMRVDASPTGPELVLTSRVDLLVSDYLAHCRAKGLAPNTVSGAYAFPLNQVFLPWCRERGIAEPEQLDSRTLDRLAAHLLENGGARGPLSKATVHSERRPINSMLKWAREEGEVGNVKAQLPRLPKTLIDVLSRQ